MEVFITNDPAGTMAVGKALGSILKTGDFVCLTGDLGAGKTLLVQGIGAGLSVQGDITSPTFTLLQVYEDGRLPVYHFDLYRLESVDELYNIGFEEYVRPDGVAIVEWADKFAAEMPDECLWIEIKIGQDADERRLTFKPGGRRYQLLCEELKRICRY